MTLRLNGSTSGYTEIDAPAVAGSNTLVLPGGNGSAGQVLSTNGSGALSWVDRMTAAGPAFSAKLSADQNGVAQSTWTKLQLATEVFDTNNCFDNATNYRFTPNVAGYYLITANIGFIDSITGQMLGSIYKNGSSYNVFVQTVGQATNPAFTGSNLIYLNGSTDFIELYGYIDSSGTRRFQSEGGVKSWMTGSFVRAA